MAENLNLRRELLSSGKKENAKIALPTAEGLTFINVLGILYCKTSGSYTDVFLKDGAKILSYAFLDRIGYRDDMERSSLLKRFLGKRRFLASQNK